MLPLKNNNRLTNCWINKRIARFTSTFPQKKKQRIERNFAGARNPRERSCKEIDKRLSTSSAAPESPIVITWREAESLEELCGMSEAPKLGGNSPGAFGSTSTAEQGGYLSLSLSPARRGPWRRRHLCESNGNERKIAATCETLNRGQIPWNPLEAAGKNKNGA